MRVFHTLTGEFRSHLLRSKRVPKLRILRGDDCRVSDRRDWVRLSHQYNSCDGECQRISPHAF